jgi:hypothetical protein
LRRRLFNKDFYMADVSDNGAFSLGLARIASDNSGPTAMANQANANASTALTQQQAQGQQIQNANNALQLQATRLGLSMLYKVPGVGVGDEQRQSDQSGSASRGAASPAAAADQSGAQGATSATDPTDDEIGSSVSHPELLDAHLRNQYTINPLGTPEEQQRIMQMSMVSALTKNPMYVQNATIQRDMSVAQRRFLAQQDASKHYDALASVADAGDHGNAFSVLQAVAPDSARKIERLHPDASDEELNDIAADTAAHFSAHIHQYTGREAEVRTDGTAIDAVTKFPIAGASHSGLTPEQYSAKIDEANKPITIKNSDGTESQSPLWEYAKSQGMPVKSAADYVKQKADAQAAIGQHQQAVRDHINAQRTQQQVQAGIPPQSGAQPGAQPGAAPQPGAGAAPADPVLRQALTDPDYKLQVPKVIKGTSQSPAQAEQAKTIVQARTDLLKDSQDATSAAAQSMQYMQAAKAILNSKQVPTTGAYGALIAKASALMPGQSVDATNYAEVAKYLGNAALAQAKGIYGARMTQSEVGLQLNELSPSTKMTDAAIRDLLDTNIRSAAYTINAARKSKVYLASGGDPQKYSDWLENYYPRAQTVNNPQPTRPGQQTSGQRTITRTGTLNGRKVVQYSDGSTGYAE